MVLTDKRLFIGGLVHDVTQQELTEKFSRFGTVHSIQIKTRHHETGMLVVTVTFFVREKVFILKLLLYSMYFKKFFVKY